MPRNSLLEMGGGGGQTTKSTYAKRGGVSIKRTCAYEGGGGGQILANLERTY